MMTTKMSGRLIYWILVPTMNRKFLYLGLVVSSPGSKAALGQILAPEMLI